ncbi:MAG: hypothetical protein Q9194_002955 [Teloschistes cf. exilis]
MTLRAPVLPMISSEEAVIRQFEGMVEYTPGGLRYLMMEIVNLWIQAAVPPPTNFSGSPLDHLEAPASR